MTDSRRLHPPDIQLLILEGVYLSVPRLLEVALDVSLSSAQAWKVSIVQQVKDMLRENKKNTQGCQEVQNVFSSLMDVYSHSNVITSMAEWFQGHSLLTRLNNKPSKEHMLINTEISSFGNVFFPFLNVTNEI